MGPGNVCGPGVSTLGLPLPLADIADASSVVSKASFAAPIFSYMAVMSRLDSLLLAAPPGLLVLVFPLDQFLCCSYYDAMKWGRSRDTSRFIIQIRFNLLGTSLACH